MRLGYGSTRKRSPRTSRSPADRSTSCSTDAACALDQAVVAHARRARGDACHAAEAAVEVLGDRRVQRDGAVEARVHQVDAPARGVHLLAPEHVGRAGRQAEAAVDAVGGVLADHAAEDPLRVELARGSARRARAAPPCSHLGSRAGRRRRPTPTLTTASSSRRACSRGRPARSGRARAPRAWRLRDSSHTDASASSPPTSAFALASWPPRRGPSLRRARRPGRDGGRRVRSAGAASRASRRATAAASSVSTTSVLLAFGSGCRRKLARAIKREAALGAADEAREVVARDVLDDLAAGVRDRPVGEHERHAEDEVARRAEAVAQRARDGCARGARRPSGPPAGRVTAADRSRQGFPAARRAERRPRPCTSDRRGRARGCGSARPSRGRRRSGPAGLLRAPPPARRRPPRG